MEISHYKISVKMDKNGHYLIKYLLEMVSMPMKKYYKGNQDLSVLNK
jgi:hypothetical protein